jgi:hypothetical protein
MGLSTQKQYRKVKDKDLPPFTPAISLFSSSTQLLLALFALNWLKRLHSMEFFAIRYLPLAINLLLDDPCFLLIAFCYMLLLSAICYTL